MAGGLVLVGVIGVVPKGIVRAASLLILAVALVVLAAGFTDAFGTGSQFEANVVGWVPDGAAPDTFWDSPIVDVPGLTVTAVHCHSRVQYELQLGATGPSHDNPCYAAMGEYQLPGGSSATLPGTGSGQWDAYITLPGDILVYRVSEDYHPWRYCIAGPVGEAPPSAGPSATPC